MPTSTSDIVFVDSGRFKPGPPIPEPVEHLIGPFPARLPCKVRFDMVGGSGSPDSKNHEQRVMHSITEGLKSRTKLHFDDEFYVLQNGLLVRRLGPIDYVMSLFSGNMTTVTLNILFGSAETMSGAAHLPNKRGEPIVNPSSGFACSQWRLCLGLPGDEVYHDHIFWDKRGLYIQSARDAWEKR